MKEKRKGPIGRAAGLAEGVAATVRRMQRDREPRVLMYDATGYAARAPAGRARLTRQLSRSPSSMVRVVDGHEP